MKTSQKIPAKDKTAKNLKSNPEGTLYKALKVQEWRFEDYEKGDIIPINLFATDEFSEIDQEALFRAVDTLVERHDSLRTLFTREEGVVYQKVCEPENLSSNVIFLDLSEKENKEELVVKILEEMDTYLFDYQQEQAFLFKCLKVEKDRSIIAFSIDHMISDAHSKKVIFEEIEVLYNAYNNGNSNPLEPLTIQSTDYSIFHNEHYDGEQGKFHETYFKELFRDLPPRLKIEPGRIGDFLKEDEFTFDTSYQEKLPSGRYRFVLSDTTSRQILALTSSLKITLYNLMLSGFCLFLSRISRQKEFFVDSPSSTRGERFQKIIGWCIGPMISRVAIDRKATFRELLEDCKDKIAKSLDHVYFNTYSELLEEKWNDVVSAQLNVLSGLHDPSPGFPTELGYDQMDNFVFDFTFNVHVYQEAIMIDCIYKTELIHETEIAKVCEYFSELLEMAMCCPDEPMKVLEPELFAI